MTEKATLRRLIRFGPFTLNESSGELCNGPTRLKVPDQSIAVLQALLEQPGELVTREALRDRLWGTDTFVDFEAGLNAAVRRLREALHDSADQPRYIETLPRRGYRFIAPVEDALAGAHPQATALAEQTSIRPLSLRRTAIAALALAVCGVAFWAALGRSNAASVVASPVPITSFPGLELDPAISPVGNLVAFAWEGESGDNFDIYVRSIDGSSQLRLTTNAAADHAPAWSPDGQRIAFVRIVDEQRVIMVMSALGGPEERLFDAGPERPGWRNGWSYGLSWTPDGNHLVFGERDPSAANSAIHVYSFENRQRQQLTHPPSNLGDIQPVVSPDGRYLAFVRLNPGDFGGDIFRQALDKLHAKGDPVQLTRDRHAESLDWAPQSDSIIYDSYDEGLGRRGLWRIAAGGGAPQPVLPNARASRPSVARVGTGAVYQTMALDSNIWGIRISDPPNPDDLARAPYRVIDSTFHDVDPQISPDGTRIVFVSTRSGIRQLWTANRDGSDQRQLTNFDGRTGSPRWSADGKRIAFDAIQGAGWNLHVVSASGGPSIPLTADAFNNVRPSWSADGRWIYFGSDRTGEWQIWRMPSAGGGKPVQITRRGGMTPIVAADGRVYYTKQAPVQGIWEVPAEGGQEVETIKQRGAFDVADNGIYVIDQSTNPYTIELFSFGSRRLVPVARLPRPRSGTVGNIAVSRDGRSIVYVQYESGQSDIEMLREFR